jgi:hypothetical protein
MKSLHGRLSIDAYNYYTNHISFYYNGCSNYLDISVKDDIFFDLHVKVEPELKKIRDTIFHIIINL